MRSIGIETTFFYYVAALTFVAFVASILLPNLKRHGYLDGDGRIEENVAIGGTKVAEPIVRRAA